MRGTAGGGQDKTAGLLSRLREGEPLSLREQVLLTTRLSVPAMLAQLSAILMGYIDASMVGRLGAEDAAAVGLVATTTWLIYGLCSAASAGFTVQIAHRIGGGDERGARSVVRHGAGVQPAAVGGLRFRQPFPSGVAWRQ